MRNDRLEIRIITSKTNELHNNEARRWKMLEICEQLPQQFHVLWYLLNSRWVAVQALESRNRDEKANDYLTMHLVATGDLGHCEVIIKAEEAMNF